MCIAGTKSSLDVFRVIQFNAFEKLDGREVTVRSLHTILKYQALAFFIMGCASIVDIDDSRPTFHPKYN
jgi:hypothetical protein